MNGIGQMKFYFDNLLDQKVHIMPVVIAHYSAD